MESQQLDFSRSNRTEILIGNNCFSEVMTKLSRITPNKHCAIITNKTVAKMYLQPLIEELEKKSFIPKTIIIQDGEQYKNFQTIIQIIKELNDHNLERNALLIGLGGGVICDIAGFVASIYKRGIPLALFPTTLLAMVDASYGGKNGINTDEGKNLVGTIYQPNLTCINVQTLSSLPLSQLSYGIVESIKHGLIADSAYYKYICNNISEIRACDLNVLQRIIRRSIYIKKDFIVNDELDKNGSRAHLNFGHTFAHALESSGKYIRLNHCEAVGLGMLMALKGAAHIGILKEDYSSQLKNVLSSFELPIKIPQEITLNSLVKFITNDKKNTDKGINFILPITAGKTKIHTIKKEDLDNFVSATMDL